MKKPSLYFWMVCPFCFLFSAFILADSQSTTATVGFTAGYTTQPVSPVDPDQPEHGAYAQGEAGPAQIQGATGAAGWLSINYVTPLVYGTQVEDGVYTVQQERPCLQTSDLRGTATGWKVTAIAGPFQSYAGAAPVPAVLSFQHGSPNSAYRPYYDPPEIPEKIELPADGGSQRLIEFAHENEGVGVWVARWYPAYGNGQDFQLRLFSPVAFERLGAVLWIMNDAP